MEDLRTRLEDAAAAGRFWEVLGDVFDERRPGDTAETLAPLLAGLHNQKRVNLVRLSGDLHREPDSPGRDLFELYWVIGLSLPALEAPAAEVVRCVCHLVREAGADGAAGMILPHFEEWLAGDAQRPLAALAAVDSEPKESSVALLPTLRVVSAQSGAEEAEEAAVARMASSVDEFAGAAVFALGDLPLHRSGLAVGERLDLLEARIRSGCGVRLRTSGVAAAIELVRKRPEVSDRCAALVASCLGNDEPQPTNSLTFRLAALADELPTGFVTSCLRSAIRAGLPPQGPLREVDRVCELLLKREGAAGEAVALVEEVLAAEPAAPGAAKGFDDRFPGFCEAARDDDGALLHGFLVRWMMSRRADLRAAIRDVIAPAEDDRGRLRVPREVSNWGDDQLRFLALRAVATFPMRPRSLVGFWLSIAAATEAAALREWIEERLFDHAGINFPASTAERLREAVEGVDDPPAAVKELAERVLERLDAFHKGLKPAESLRELRPSSQCRRAAGVRRERLHREIQRRGDERSVFLQAVTRHRLLHGRGSVHHRPGEGDDPPERVENPMHRVKVSMEVPRATTVDLIGYENLLSYANAILFPEDDDEAAAD